MTAQQYQSAAPYWTSKFGIEMPTAELKQCTEEFITTHSVCALATGADQCICFALALPEWMCFALILRNRDVTAGRL